MARIGGLFFLFSQAMSRGATRALIFRNSIQDPFPESAIELYDRIGRGRIDVFFLGGGQIDGEANLNMVGVGAYPRSRVRFPGCHGTPFIYMMVPRPIVSRGAQCARAGAEGGLHQRAGHQPSQCPPPRGPTDLVTAIVHFRFDRVRRCFTLVSVHPGHGVDEVVERTGFEFQRAEEVRETPAPSPEQLRLIRGRVAAEVSQTYPEYAASKLGCRTP